MIRNRTALLNIQAVDRVTQTVNVHREHKHGFVGHIEPSTGELAARLAIKFY